MEALLIYRKTPRCFGCFLAAGLAFRRPLSDNCVAFLAHPNASRVSRAPQVINPMMSTSFSGPLRAAFAGMLFVCAGRANTAKADPIYVREAFITANNVTAPPPPLTTAPTGATPTIAPRPFSTPAPKPKPQMADAKKLLELLRNRDVCKIPLDLRVNNATLEEIAARVQKMIAAPAPKIVVRGALPVRLSFALKNSTVGDALGSAGLLAGAKLWVFADHLLLAPEAALSKEEQAALKENGGNEWGFNNSNKIQFFVWDNELRRVFTNLIGDELKAKFSGATPATTAPVAGQVPVPVAKTTFSQLSPEAKEMVQQLVEQSNQRQALQQTMWSSGGVATPRFDVSPDSIVQLSPDNSIVRMKSGTPAPNAAPSDTWLKIENSTGQMGWTLSGNGILFGNGGSRPPQPKPTPPPFLDPSAGKS